jgi:hypothetical protein
MQKLTLKGKVMSVRLSETEKTREPILLCEVQGPDYDPQHHLREGDKVENFYLTIPVGGFNGQLPQLGEQAEFECLLYKARHQHFDQVTRQNKFFNNLRLDCIGIKSHGKMHAVKFAA